MKTLLITPQDICEVVKRIGLDTVMDKVIADLKIAFQEAGSNRNGMRVRDGFIAEDGSFSCIEMYTTSIIEMASRMHTKP